MHSISATCSPDELPAFISALIEAAGWTKWSRRIETLQADEKVNALWSYYIQERHALELTLGAVRQYQKRTGRYPWPPRTIWEHRLYSFAAMFSRSSEHLSAAAAARLAGMVAVGLEKEFGLGPLAFEMGTASHLALRGCKLYFHDLETGGGFDFLAELEGCRFEVECKHLSADVGRQIHRRKVYDLGTVLTPHISRALDRLERPDVGRLIKVELPGRLTGTVEQRQAICDRIAVVLSDAASIDDEHCTITPEPFSTPSALRHSNISLQTAQELIRQQLALENENALLMWSPGKGAIAVTIASKRQDKVLSDVLDKMKFDAKRQFSKTLPAFLCAHLADVSEVELRSLADAEKEGTVTGIRLAINKLLNDRPHLHSVALMAAGRVVIDEQQSQTQRLTSFQESGPCYCFSPPDRFVELPVLQSVFRSR